MKLDVRSILIEKGKLQAQKLQDLSSKKANVKNKEKVQNSKKRKSSAKGACNIENGVNKIEMKQSSSSVDPKKGVLELVSKRVDSEEKEREKCSKQVGLEEKLKSWQWRVPEVKVFFIGRNSPKFPKFPFYPQGPIKFDIGQIYPFFPAPTQTTQIQPRDGPTL